MPTTFTITEVRRAARLCTALARRKPHWPRARVRRAVARVLGLRTWQLRYLLRRADEVLRHPTGPPVN